MLMDICRKSNLFVLRILFFYLISLFFVETLFSIPAEDRISKKAWEGKDFPQNHAF